MTAPAKRCACAPGCKGEVDPGTLEDGAQAYAAFLASSAPEDVFCTGCEEVWLGSPERSRDPAQPWDDLPRAPWNQTALADFARLRSAELLNGGRRDP